MLVFAGLLAVAADLDLLLPGPLGLELSTSSWLDLLSLGWDRLPDDLAGPLPWHALTSYLAACRTKLSIVHSSRTHRELHSFPVTHKRNYTCFLTLAAGLFSIELAIRFVRTNVPTIWAQFLSVCTIGKDHAI